MNLSIPHGIRYWMVNYLELNPSSSGAFFLRGLIRILLLLMLVPWAVAKEISYGSSSTSLDLKSSLRSMLWIWNRSWIPFKLKLGTYFDIGWCLSLESCDALAQRRFVSHKSPKRQCDFAQLKLSKIRDSLQTENQSRLLEADGELLALVNDVLNNANKWAVSEDATETVPTDNLENANTSNDIASHSFDNSRTKAALFDFDDLCKSLELEFFLVSGTFLGAVRDEAFIGHDHDIDVGMFEENSFDGLIRAVTDSENFVLNQVDRICLRQVSQNHVHYALMEKPSIIRIAHKTGISIDVFVHFKDGDLIWHGSSVHRWNNSAFKLVDYDFLGRSFKGAADFDRYLNENYGPDWRVPKQKFNVNFDTPNLSFVGTANALVFFAWIIAAAVEADEPARVEKYIELLLSIDVVELQQGVIRIK